MSVNRRFCAEQVERFDCLPYWQSMGLPGRKELIDALLATATEDAQVSGAIAAWLSDAATNRPPTPGELRALVESQRGGRYDQHQPQEGKFCDRCRGNRPPGWISIIRTVKGMPYEYSGRCKCQPGGWV